MLPFGSLAGAPRPPDHDGTGTPPSPLLTVQEVDGGSRPPNTDPDQAFPSPIPLLTVEKVLRVFENARKITTPEVNSKLAIPYKKPEIEKRTEFKQAYSAAKQNINRVSGQSAGDREEEKGRRRSLPFDWPTTCPGIVEKQLFVEAVVELEPNFNKFIY